MTCNFNCLIEAGGLLIVACRQSRTP